MAEHESVVARYRELLEVSSMMLGYARSQDWEALIQQEARYAVELDRVRLIGDQGGGARASDRISFNCSN